MTQMFHNNKSQLVPRLEGEKTKLIERRIGCESAAKASQAKGMSANPNDWGLHDGAFPSH